MQTLDTCQQVNKTVNSSELWPVDSIFQRAVAISGCRQTSWVVDSALPLSESECV